jgi:large subunit ribosomal protein L31
MKSEIHPKFYSNARVICSCGNTWTTGSTKEEIRTDVCFQCHPFFTGEQRIVDTAGQVDRFMKRLDRYSSHQSQESQRQQALRQKTEQRFLKQQLAALDLSDRVMQILHDNSIITVGDLTKKVEGDRNSLLKLEGFGPKALEEAEAKLQEARDAFFTAVAS